MSKQLDEKKRRKKKEQNAQNIPASDNHRKHGQRRLHLLRRLQGRRNRNFRRCLQRPQAEEDALASSVDAGIATFVGVDRGRRQSYLHRRPLLTPAQQPSPASTEDAGKASLVGFLSQRRQ
ncbi:hypothetical protein FH972_008292 [Carpinus fangiana]|uniref:Uncharacterized protein n=1 Tax=Carpinus fangiana TaxID=176857 RepID=A0A5N6QY99_9ROSI|nr:hypothetical protein FH972_008292 [Carpinus fangiana]